MKTPDKLYRFHVANLRSVHDAPRRIARSARDAVARSESTGIETFNRLYALLLGAWAECRLSKLLFEPNGFSARNGKQFAARRATLIVGSTLVELAFRKHYGVPKVPLTPSVLSHSAWSRLVALNDSLNNDLRFIVTLRNKLAHGQWIYPLNETGDDVAQEQMASLCTENILSLEFKKKILDNLLNAVFDLAVSKPTFERDFDCHFAGVELCSGRT